MLKSLKSLPFGVFSSIPLESEEDLEKLKKEVVTLPYNHPLETLFEFDKLGNLYFKGILNKNEVSPKTFILISKLSALKYMQELYISPGNAFMGKRGFMYYFKVHGIYVKVRWIEEFLKNNILHQMKRNKSKNFIVKPILAKGPYEHWQIDLIDFSNLKDSKSNMIQVIKENQNEIIKNSRYIMVIVDIFSKFCYLRALPTKTAHDVWIALKDVLDKSAHHPKILQHDKGNEFRGEVEQKLKEEFPQIESRFSLAYKPQSQGHVERLNKTIKNYLRQHYYLTGTTDFVQVLPAAEHRINSTYQESIETEPVFIHFKLPDSITLPTSYEQFKKDFVTNNKIQSERSISKKYYGDYDSLSEEIKKRLPIQVLNLIGTANWLMLRKAEKKLGKFEKYHKLVDPFINRDLIKDPLYVLISIDSLKQRTKDKDKISKESKTKLKIQWSKVPTRVTRIWFDQLKNPRIVTQMFPMHSFYPHEVIVTTNFEEQKQDFTQKWEKNLQLTYLEPSTKENLKNILKK
jgi:hypothetical protein